MYLFNFCSDGIQLRFFQSLNIYLLAHIPTDFFPVVKILLFIFTCNYGTRLGPETGMW
jgi:hypothetical protein